MDYFSSSKSAQVSKSAACAKVLVSRNSLYYKPKLPAKDLLLKQQIEAILFEHKSYGHRRIAIALGINKKRVLRVMKLFNLKPKKLRKKPRFKKNKFPKNSAKNLILDLQINQPKDVCILFVLHCRGQRNDCVRWHGAFAVAQRSNNCVPLLRFV